jgi:hypothetical protein
VDVEAAFVGRYSVDKVGSVCGGSVSSYDVAVEYTGRSVVVGYESFTVVEVYASILEGYASNTEEELTTEIWGKCGLVDLEGIT